MRDRPRSSRTSFRPIKPMRENQAMRSTRVERRNSWGWAIATMAAACAVPLGCSTKAAPCADAAAAGGLRRRGPADDRPDHGRAERDDPGPPGGLDPGPGPRVPQGDALRGGRRRQEGPAPVRHRRGAVQGRARRRPRRTLERGRGRPRRRPRSPRRGRSPRRSSRSTRRSSRSPRSRSGASSRCCKRNAGSVEDVQRKPGRSARRTRRRSRPTRPAWSRPRPTTRRHPRRPGRGRRRRRPRSATPRSTWATAGCRSPIDGRIGVAQVKVGQPRRPGGRRAAAPTTPSWRRPAARPDGRRHPGLAPATSTGSTRLIDQGLAVEVFRPGLEGEEARRFPGKATSSTTRSTRRPPPSWSRRRSPTPSGRSCPASTSRSTQGRRGSRTPSSSPSRPWSRPQAGPTVYIVDAQGKVADRPASGRPSPTRACASSNRASNPASR